MRVWLYAIIRNEERILPYFLRHYERFCDWMFFFDDNSDDRTREILREHRKAVVLDWPGPSGLRDDEFLKFANSRWKEDRDKTDWVIWVDIDEFLYHPEICLLLKKYLDEGVEVPKIQGYTMVSKTFPDTKGQIWEQMKTGFPDTIWSKYVVFRPHIEMEWSVGRHGISHEVMKVRTSAAVELKLLHYRCLGMEYLEWRHRRNWSRVPEECRRQNLGANCDPGFQGAYGIEWFRQRLNEEHPEVI